MKRKRLGEVLHARGKISAAKLQQALEEQYGKVIRLGELILERGLADKAALVDALEEVSRVKYVDCATVKCEKKALLMVPHAVATRLLVLPVSVEGSNIVMAMHEPQNILAVDELRFLTGRNISARMAFRSEIVAAIARNYAHGKEGSSNNSEPDQEMDTFTTGSGPGEPDQEIEFTSTSSRQSNPNASEEIAAELTQKKTPAVRVVSRILREAIHKGASDVHIEPQSEETLIRVRVDGILRELESVPRTLQNALISRIKILSDMDISERRAPQDGRFLITLGDRTIEIRVSTLPTQYGEKIVMRLLETNAPMLDLTRLGFPQEIATQVLRLLAAPQGMLLVTGPTGSGKSTTLYSMLHLLRKPAVNIVTVEDPVEYVLPGVNHVHVNTRAGLTFASCLRSILRQDPNVIMVGEIRDRETAEIAMKAAQTGHLVLSTLHTNDSVSAIARLLDLGIPGYLIESSVTGILAQRLVRKLCVCQRRERATAEYAATLAAIGGGEPPEYVPRALGCEICDNTGYKGRLGVYELLTLDEPVRRIIHEGFRPEAILHAAREAGMKTMQEAALAKLQAGVTTLEEIQRAVPFDLAVSVRCSRCGHELLPTFRFCPMCGDKCETNQPSNARSSMLVPAH